MARPAESARFYDDNCTCIDKVEKAKKDGFRNPTITDARKNGWRPSVSEVLKRVSAVELEYWKIGQAIRTAHDNPMEELEDIESYVTRIAESAKTFSKLAAERGTLIHGEIDEFLTNGTEPRDPASYEGAMQIRKFLDSRGVTSTITEQSFSSKTFGWAGTPDIVTEGGVYDIKTTDLSKFRSPYYKWGLQVCGGYGLPIFHGDHEGIEEAIKALEGKEFANLVVDRESGQLEVCFWGDKKLHTPADLARAFMHIFDEWCLFNKYDPRRHNG